MLAACTAGVDERLRKPDACYSMFEDAQMFDMFEMWLRIEGVNMRRNTVNMLMRNLEYDRRLDEARLNNR